jgi:hypothetical protein
MFKIWLWSVFNKLLKYSKGAQLRCMQEQTWSNGGKVPKVRVLNDDSRLRAQFGGGGQFWGQFWGQNALGGTFWGVRMSLIVLKCLRGYFSKLLFVL